MRRRLLNPRNRREALKAAAAIWGDPEKRKAAPGKAALQNSLAKTSTTTGAQDIADVAPDRKEREADAHHRR
jgi:hypothetical protein